ncbi:SapC family protein [Thalassotalea sp. LPB0316]|uniref:SapC family protein n=1 Tax=Thalassotalea sp. LPB0316 TaxID=2769490 RepID=UPI00186947EE|nr:SapC family protein [Thalassotalea sp. LPB0316]QOL25828.1 SapC family protein [Thalassotalea sp. LPB0316]
MENLAPLSPQNHSALFLKEGVDFPAIKAKRNAMVMVSEFAVASTSYPLFFINNTATNQLEAIALMALDSHNVFFPQENALNIAYLPKSLSLLPFQVVADPNNPNRVVPLIDTNSSLLSMQEQEQSAKLFNDDGSPTNTITSKQEAMRELYQHEITTIEFINQLTRLNLLKELDLEVTFSGGEKTTIKGLFTIKEEALANLTAEDKTLFEQRGYMPAIYAMLASLSQMNRMLQLHNHQQPANLIENLQFKLASN